MVDLVFLLVGKKRLRCLVAIHFIEHGTLGNVSFYLCGDAQQPLAWSFVFCIESRSGVANYPCLPARAK